MAILGGLGAVWLALGACSSDDDGYGTGGTGPSSSGVDAAPPGVCGNDATEAGEACDGTDLNGHSCATLTAELTGGSLGCRPDCTGYDIAQCQAAGQTIEASSCEQEDIQAAIDSASDGDIVTVPAGQCTWASAAGCDGRVECSPVHIVAKSILLRGAGTEQTLITTHVPEGWQYSSIYVASEAGKPIRISGFAFQEVIAPAISVSGDNQSFRLDHLSVRPPTGESIVAIEVTGSAVGVIDHAVFDTAEVLVLADEDDAWNRPLSLGTEHAVYVEDSIFTTAGAINDVIDGRSGARFVFRHNEVTNLELHCHGIEGGGDRGTHSYELYGNTGICDGATNCYRMAYLRGGTGVVFDNSWSGDWSMSGLQVVHQCVYHDGCTGFKACHAYPCNDQIGRTTDHDDNGVQDLMPLFEWNNTVDGEDLDLVVQDGTYPEMAYFIQEGRDFHNDRVSWNDETESYEATFPDDNADPRTWRYRPYAYPHPLVALEADLP